MTSSLVRPSSEGYPGAPPEFVELLTEGSKGSEPEFGDEAVAVLVDELSLELLLELLLDVLSQAVRLDSSRA